VKALERAGYGVILDSEISTMRRFERTEDERRAENFMGMWLDPRVKAVIGGTGGYGAARMIPHLEPEVFRRNPKSFVGYSDITALHLWLMRRSSLRVFHGPTVDDLIPSTRDPTMASLLSALTTPRPTTRMGRDVARAVRPGRAVGRLTGGNLSLVQLLGRTREIDTGRDSVPGRNARSDVVRRRASVPARRVCCAAQASSSAISRSIGRRTSSKTSCSISCRT
jgi:muramoyltetrapeptide carboxypeptidase